MRSCISIQRSLFSVRVRAMANTNPTIVYSPGLLIFANMGLSTHILDTSRGKPASNVTTTLYRGTGDVDKWEKAGEGTTDNDGRYKGFFAEDPTGFTNGVYKLRFEVGHYYNQLNVDTLYPFVEIVFEIKDAKQHYHIPLLLNPFGYSTYRGS